jgi:5-methylcytosine-specific restriction endonuclease McrA
MDNIKVTVLNRNYEYLNSINWQKAIKLIVKGKVTVIKYTEMVVNTAEHMVVKIPLVIKLIKLIRTIYRTKVPFSKKNVMIRDGFACQYCGRTTGLTIDHVIPRSKRGKSTFENCVAACKQCNSKKGSKLPSEASMYLKKQPFAPTIAEFTRSKAIKSGMYDILKDFGVY